MYQHGRHSILGMEIIMSIHVGYKVKYELGPKGLPRWIPHPDRPDNLTFLDTGYTGKYGLGYVDKLYYHPETNELMISIMFASEYRVNNAVGIYMMMEAYEKNKGLPGFYRIENPSPECQCGCTNGTHWKFCPAWKGVDDWN